MSLESISVVSGKAVPINGDDIDTDQIIPARFMKCLTFDGLGEYLFHDVRKAEDGSEKPHSLNEEKFAEATIMIAGNNYGCGSSREHAPQSIYRAGFRAIVAEGFAEIFFGNATNLGIPCVVVEKEDRKKMTASIEKAPETTITIDLNKMEIQLGSESFKLKMPDSARSALINGRWDPLSELLEAKEKTDLIDQSLAY